jgi:FMN-dependent NADH-azoreductase
MKRLIHIIATPRGEESRTLSVSGVFLEAFQKKHADWVIDELNLCTEKLPSLTQKSVSGKYVLLQGKNLRGSLKDTWNEILQHIDRFKNADFFLISAPMWNFSIPYILKQYIDLIVQPRYLFAYKEDGTVEGLVKGKKMVIITSRGGTYGGEAQKFDHQEPYLRAIFGFVGFTDIAFIRAEGMDMGEERRESGLKAARKLAQEMGQEK